MGAVVIGERFAARQRAQGFGQQHSFHSEYGLWESRCRNSDDLAQVCFNFSRVLLRDDPAIEPEGDPVRHHIRVDAT